MAELTMVYGRYNELDNYGIHGVNKPNFYWLVVWNIFPYIGNNHPN